MATSKTVTIAVHERTVYVSPRVELVRSYKDRQVLHPGMHLTRPLDRIEISGVGDGAGLTTTIHQAPVKLARFMNGTVKVLGPAPVPDVTEQVRQVQALTDAMWQLLDDMGADGLSVSPAAKEQALAAFTPFRDDEEEGDDEATLDVEDWP